MEKNFSMAGGEEEKNRPFYQTRTHKLCEQNKEAMKKRIQQYDKYNLKVSKEDSMIALRSIYFFTVLLVAFG